MHNRTYLTNQYMCTVYVRAPVCQLPSNIHMFCIPLILSLQVSMEQAVIKYKTKCISTFISTHYHYYNIIMFSHVHAALSFLASSLAVSGLPPTAWCVIPASTHSSYVGVVQFPHSVSGACCAHGRC